MSDIINMTITTPPAVNQSITGFGIKGDTGATGAQGPKGDAGDPATNLVASVAGKTGAVTLDKTDVGLSNVDNTSDANKPVSTVQQAALDGKATKLDIAQYSVPYRDVAGNGEPNTYMSVVQSNASGNSIARRTADGKIFTVAGTDNNHAINKAQMDTANALKVNKAGDTMTGRLGNATANLSTSNTRGGKEILFGATAVGNFGVLNNTDGIEAFNVMSDGSGIRLGTSNGLAILKGTGFPEGVVTAPAGSIYIDTAITNGASSWIKKSGTGNTGWQVLEGDTGWRDVSALRDAFWSLGNLQVRRVGQEVYFRCWGVTVASSPSGLRTSGRTLLTTGSFPVGFRYASSWGISTGWIGSVVLANRNGRVATGNSYEDLSASIPNGEATPGSWTAGDVVSGQFSYTTTDSWPTTLPGTAA